MRTSVLLTRIAARTGMAVWRHRYAWLAAAVLASALGVYQMAAAGPSLNGGGEGNGDCVDTTMAAVTSTDAQTARAAYACLGPAMRSTPEDAWVAGMRQRDAPRGHVSRIGGKRTSDGGQIVFFTVEQQGQAVGYIVYLDPQGKVRAVE